MTTSNKKLQGKLLNEDNKTIVEQRDLETITTHPNTIQKKSIEGQDLTVSIQELKFEEGENETAICNWGANGDKEV